MDIGRKCFLKQCPAIGPELLFCFPEHPKQERKWRENLGISTLERIAVEDRNLCISHFEDLAIVLYRKNLRLRPGAVPTLNLGHNAPPLHNNARKRMTSSDILLDEPSALTTNFLQIEYNDGTPSLAFQNMTDNSNEIIIDDEEDEGKNRVCCIKNCWGKRNAILYPFPAKEEERIKWAIACGITPSDCGDQQIYVCNRHFEECMLDNGNLKQGAVPSLNLEFDFYDSESSVIGVTSSEEDYFLDSKRPRCNSPDYNQANGLSFASETIYDVPSQSVGNTTNDGVAIKKECIFDNNTQTAIEQQRATSKEIMINNDSCKETKPFSIETITDAARDDRNTTNNYTIIKEECTDITATASEHQRASYNENNDILQTNRPHYDALNCNETNSLSFEIMYDVPQNDGNMTNDYVTIKEECTDGNITSRQSEQQSACRIETNESDNDFLETNETNGIAFEVIYGAPQDVGDTINDYAAFKEECTVDNITNVVSTNKQNTDNDICETNTSHYDAVKCNERNDLPILSEMIKEEYFVDDKSTRQKNTNKKSNDIDNALDFETLEYNMDILPQSIQNEHNYHTNMIEGFEKCEKCECNHIAANEKIIDLMEQIDILRKKCNDLEQRGIMPHRKANENAITFARMIVKPQNKKYKDKEKSLAKKIYDNSPCSYNYMRRTLGFGLPFSTSLNTYITGVTGINDDAADNLETIFTQMSESERICKLMYDEVFLDADEANLCYLFTINGIFSDWKYILSYYVTKTALLPNEVIRLLLMNIDFVVAVGFKVRALVCAQTPCTMQMFKKLNVTVDKPYIMHLDEKIHCFFDYFQLIKSIRNCFAQYDIGTPDGIAKFSIIKDLFRINCQLFPNLTKTHITVYLTKISSINLATELLSHSVSNGIEMAINQKILSQCRLLDARATQKFLQQINDIFDELDYRKQHQDYMAIVKSLKDHLNFIQSLSVKNKIILFHFGLSLTIASLINLYDDVFHKYIHLNISQIDKMNLELLQNLLSELCSSRNIRTFTPTIFDIQNLVQKVKCELENKFKSKIHEKENNDN